MATVEKIEFGKDLNDTHRRPKRHPGAASLRSEFHYVKCTKTAYLFKVLKLIRASDHVENAQVISVVFADQKLDYVHELTKIANEQNVYLTSTHMVFIANAKLRSDGEPLNFLLMPNSDLTNQMISAVFTFAVQRGFTWFVIDQLYSLGMIEKFGPLIRKSKGLFKTVTICYPAKFGDVDIAELLALSPTKPYKQGCC